MKDLLTYAKARIATIDGFHLTFGLLVATLVLLDPSLGFAQGLTFKQGLCNAVELVTSDAGKAIATAAIITIAIGALLGRVSWGMAVMIAAGIAGIFGAPTIASFIAGEGGDGGDFCG